MKFTVFTGLSAGIFALSLCASPAVAQSAVAPAAARTNAAVERALVNVDAGHIEADLRFIADDLMRGRDTTSTQQQIAARFIRARLQRIGFEPGAANGYLFEYPLNGKSLLRESLAADLTIGEQTQTLTYGKDYVIAGRWAVADLESDSKIVYCGAGTKEDFKSETLEGNWALCTYSGQNLWRIFSPARQAGAIGLLLITDPEAEVGSVVPHFKVSNSGAFEQRVSWPAEGNQRQQRPAFPILALSDEWKASLLADSPAVGSVLNSSLRDERKMIESDVVAENVCGLWPGSDPKLRNEVIIVSAHYDHIGVSGDNIYNGADDNGSGTCGMMALAEALVEYGPMKRSIMLIWVSGEEKGLWGSRAWAQNPSLAGDMKAVANINIDMIGRNAPKVLYVTPSSKHNAYNGLTQLMETFGAEEGFGDFAEGKKQGLNGLGSADDYYFRSDHAEFAKLGIPVCFLFAGVHEDYHRHTDTVDKIDFDKITRVVRMVIKGLDAMQGETLDLELTAQGSR